MTITQLLTHSTRAAGATLVLATGACSASEAVRSATPETTPTTASTAFTDDVVYRDVTAYEISVCWRNVDGSIGFPTGGAVPGSEAVIGNVHLYAPFDVDGTRRTDIDTFTRCEFLS